MDIYVGTSGYSYKEWLGTFYPGKLPASQMLAHYARHFRTVEINNTFYRMPTEKMLVEWCSQVPTDFSFVLKTSRKITHVKRLKGVEDETSYLLRAMSALGDRKGPMLVQLPPNFRKNLEVLRAFLELLPDGWQAAFEFRHGSWHDDEIHALLARRNMAFVTADVGDEPAPIIAGADWGYLRLRSDRYTDAELGEWCNALRRQTWAVAYVFFKHEDSGAGPELASRFTVICEAASAHGNP